MSVKFTSLVLSLILLLVGATFASAQKNTLIVTFDDSGPSITATVNGYFETSGMTFERQTYPNPPGMFGFHSSTGFFWGATTTKDVDVYTGAMTTGPEFGFPYLFNFFHGGIETPLSEYFDIGASSHTGFPFSTITLAEGETSFNADTLENNVIVFEEVAVVYGMPFTLDNTFLTTTPITVLSDATGENIIQFVRAAEIVLGDVNRDGVVSFLDISPFIGLLSSGDYQEAADVNLDGYVSFLDISEFVSILAGGGGN